MIIMVFGLPGSGKSYFAERLVKVYKAAYLSSDRVRKEISNDPEYSEDQKLRIYESMLSRIENLCKENAFVVLDATFYKKSIRQQFIEKADLIYQQLVFIEVQASEGIIYDRVSRPRDRSDADFEVYKTIKRQFEPLEESHLVLQSTNDNINSMLEDATAHIESKTKK